MTSLCCGELGAVRCALSGRNEGWVAAGGRRWNCRGIGDVNFALRVRNEGWLVGQLGAYDLGLLFWRKGELLPELRRRRTAGESGSLC